MQGLNGSIERDASPPEEGQNNPYVGLIESLAGDVIVTYARGRRILDLGQRSRAISKWVEQVSPYPVASWPNDGHPLPQDPKDIHLHQDSSSVDLIYSMWTFSHLGQDKGSSVALARAVLSECARVVRPGGHLLLHTRNAASLRGAWSRAGRSLISHPALKASAGYERWDTLSGFVRMLPPNLEMIDGHGLGVLTLNATLLSLPILGQIGKGLAWRLRDSKNLRHLAGDVLTVVRRVPEPNSLPPL